MLEGITAYSIVEKGENRVSAILFEDSGMMLS